MDIIHVTMWLFMTSAYSVVASPKCLSASLPVQIYFKTHVMMCLDLFLIYDSVLITASVHYVLLLPVSIHVCSPVLACPLFYHSILNVYAIYPEDLYVFLFFLNSCIQEPSACTTELLHSWNLTAGCSLLSNISTGM